MADPTPLLGLDRNNTRIALNKLDLMGGLLGTFAPDMDTIVASTRTFGYRGARFRDGLGGVSFEPDGTIVCTDNAVSYVQYDAVGGITIAATLDPAKYAIAEVTCASGAITHIEDLRDLNLHDLPRLHLDDLLDVEIYSPAEGDTLRFDSASGLWLNVPSGTVGGVDAEQTGTLILADASILDFRGDVVVTDQGSGRARVQIQSSGGGIGFPYSAPVSPSAYDDEGKTGTLSGIWTEVDTPGAGFTKGSGFQGDYLYMDSPGAAAGNRWLLRQAIGAEGAAGTLMTVTSRLLLPSGAGVGFVDIGISDNATFVTGNYWLAALVGNKVQVYDGTLRVDTLIGTFNYELWIHVRRGTDNVLRFYASINGIAWRLVYTSAAWAHDIDYIWIRMLGSSTPGQTSRHLVDFVRVNDPRFDQFV